MNDGARWTDEELATLHDLHTVATVRELAEALPGRTPAAIDSKLRSMGLRAKRAIRGRPPLPKGYGHGPKGSTTIERWERVVLTHPETRALPLRILKVLFPQRRLDNLARLRFLIWMDTRKD